MHQFPLEPGKAGWMLCRGCRSVLLLLCCCPAPTPPQVPAHPTCSHPCSICHLPLDTTQLQRWEGPQEISYSLCRIKHTQILSDGCLSNLLLKIPQECCPKISLFCLF